MYRYGNNYRYHIWSFALIIKALLPFIAACLACTKIRESASSCVQGAKLSNLFLLPQPVHKKMEKFSLVVVISRKAFPILGSLAGWCNPSYPFAPFGSCSTFSLDSLYTSNTMSILWYSVGRI